MRFNSLWKTLWMFVEMYLILLFQEHKEVIFGGELLKSFVPIRILFYVVIFFAAYLRRKFGTAHEKYEANIKK